MTSRRRPWRGLGLRRTCALAGAATLGLAGCASDDTTSPFVSAVEPTDVLIESADASGVVLRWVHRDDDEEGFAVRRVVGNTASILATLPPDTETYTDANPNLTLPMSYAIEAIYGETRARSEMPAVLELDILPPGNVDATIDSGVVRVHWLPPDFEQFEGFQVQRIITRDGDALIDATATILHDTSVEAAWHDDMLPVGLVGDRLSYQVATSRIGELSPPVFTNAFQWSLPARPILSSLAVPHADAAARHVTARDAGIVAYVRDDGSARLDIIDANVQSLVSYYIYRHEESAGTLAGALPSPDLAVVAHASASADTVTLRGIAVDGEQEVWSLETTAPRAFVTEGPTAGTIMYADGASFVTANAATGGESARTPIDDTAALARVLAADRLVAVETRESTGTSQARVTLRAYPSGALVWTTRWFTGELLEGDASLVVSAAGNVLALNLALATGDRTVVLRAADGSEVGAADGRTVGFTGDEQRAAVVESPPGWPRAYRIDDALRAEDRFGSENMTAAFFDAARDRLWTFHTSGTIRLFALEMQWTPVVEGRTGRHAEGTGLVADLDAGVPRFELRTR